MAMERDRDQTILDKIESQLLKLIESTTAMSTKLDIFVSRQEDHEGRLKSLEEYRNKQDGVNESTARRHNRIIMVILASEVVLFGTGIILSTAIKGC